MSELRSCGPFQEAISARADGEGSGIDDDALDSHLRTCSSCRMFEEQLATLARQMRVRPAPVVPDLTERIMAATSRSKTQAGADLFRRVPSARRGLGVAAAVVVAAALIGAAAGAAWSQAHRRTATAAQIAGPAQTSPRYPGALILPRDVAKPSVTLTDTSGRPFDLASQTGGRLTLVYFGYTHCPDVCPLNMAIAASAIHLLPASERSEIAVVFVTTDPTRDTPAVIRTWLNHFDPSFVGLTGTITGIHQAEQEVAMPMSYADSEPGGSGEIVHAGYTLVYAPAGTARLQVDSTEKPSDFAATLRSLLAHGFQPA